MLIPLSHWAHGRGAAHKLHIAALCGGLSLIPTDSLSLSLGGGPNQRELFSLVPRLSYMRTKICTVSDEKLGDDDLGTRLQNIIRSEFRTTNNLSESLKFTQTMRLAECSEG